MGAEWRGKKVNRGIILWENQVERAELQSLSLATHLQSKSPTVQTENHVKM